MRLEHVTTLPTVNRSPWKVGPIRWTRSITLRCMKSKRSEMLFWIEKRIDTTAARCGMSNALFALVVPADKQMPMINIRKKQQLLPVLRHRLSHGNTVVLRVSPVLNLKWITTSQSVDPNISHWSLVGHRGLLSFLRSFHRETKRRMSSITSNIPRNNKAMPMTTGQTGMNRVNSRQSSCPLISGIQHPMGLIVVVKDRCNRKICPRNPLDTTNKALRIIERNPRRKRVSLVEFLVHRFDQSKERVFSLLVATRSSDVSSSKADAKPGANKAQPVWRPLSPTRPLVTNDPTPQEAISYKSQIKPTEQSTQLNNERRQSAPAERKSRYTTNTAAINMASIPPLMSVRSDVPAPSTTSGSKHFKNSNVSHYSQHNDFYNEGADPGWGNEDEYYEDETGYYDSTNSNHSRHQQSMTYHSHSHHRGYTTLGPYGRYRRGGALRHQQPYSSYAPPGASSQVNTGFGSRTKKTVSHRTATPPTKAEETSEPPKAVPEEPVKKSSVWATESKPKTVEEIPIIKSNETPIVAKEIESTHDTVQFTNEPKPLLSMEHEPVLISVQSDADASGATNKRASSATNAQKKANQEQRYQQQQAPRHRNTYERSMQGTFSLSWMSVLDSFFHWRRLSVEVARAKKLIKLFSIVILLLQTSHPDRY